MVNTKFGKRLFGLFLAFICVFALIGCTKDAQIKEAALKDAQEKVDEIYSKIYWSKDSMSQVTADVKGFITETLYENVTVSWESSEEDILSATGKVTLPSWEDERNVVVKEATEDEPAVKVVPVKVTATITGVAEWEVKGKTYTQEVTAVKEFNFTVKALAEGADKVETILSAKQKAAAYIYDEKGVARDCSVSGDNSAFYTTTVKGVVVAVLASGGQFMVHDGTDGIYVYVAVEGIKVGDQVTVAGDIMTYYASLQFGKQSNVTIEKDGTAKAGEYREVTAQELETEASELMEDGKSLKKAGFLGGELVNVYGKLNYDGANSLTGERYYIADAKTGERVWIYRSSYEEDKPAALEAMLGKYVKVRGVTYGRDSRLQRCRIVWDGTIVEAEGVEVSEAEQVQIALNSVSCPAEAKENFELSAVEGVANYAWTIVSGTGIELEGLNAKVTRTEADQTVVLKLEITIGATTDSKEFTVKVPLKAAEVDPDAGYVDLTVTTLDLASGQYAAGTVEYAGVKFEYTELGNYGNGIQMRIKEGKTSTLWNTTAFAKPIVKIELAVAASKKAYDNNDALIFSFGNAADGLNEEVRLSTVADNKTYVVTPSAATYTFFKVQHNLSKNSGYWDYIRVWFEDGTADAPTPEPDPEPLGEVTIAEALKAADGTEVTIKATVHVIDSAWDTEFKNMNVTLKDATGTLYVYRLATQVKLGDIVTVTGKMGTYLEARQIGQGATAVVTGHDTSYDPAVGSVSISFASTANRTSLTTTQQVWEQNGIKVTGDKASSSNEVKDYSNPARFYKGSNLTIEFTSAISKIVITCSGGKDYYILEGQAVSAGTLTVEDAKCTITFDTPVTSVVLTNLGKQTRITTIEVTPAQ